MIRTRSVGLLAVFGLLAGCNAILGNEEATLGDIGGSSAGTAGASGSGGGSVTGGSGGSAATSGASGHAGANAGASGSSGQGTAGMSGSSGQGGMVGGSAGAAGTGGAQGGTSGGSGQGGAAGGAAGTGGQACVKTMACTDCVQTSCTASSQACMAQPDCLQFLLCTFNCCDAACVGNCLDAAKVETKEMDDAIQCTINQCATECSVSPTCGYAFEGDPCDSCVGGACCADVAKCEADAECAGILACAGKCTGAAACVVNCVSGKSQAATDLFTNVSACRSQNCSGICPGTVGAGGAGGSGGAGAGGTGGAGAGGSGGAGAGGTGGSTCVDSPPKDCTNCYTCATDPGGPCADLDLQCMNDTECNALVGCTDKCSPGQTPCFQTCYDMHPSAQSLYSQLQTCAICQTCPSACDAVEFFLCGGGTGGSAGSSGAGGSAGRGGAAGTGGSGGAGGACTPGYTCNDALNGDPSMLCPGTIAANDWAALYDCLCVNVCQTDCSDECSGGGFGSACQTCALGNCGSQLDACMTH